MLWIVWGVVVGVPDHGAPVAAKTRDGHGGHERVENRQQLLQAKEVPRRLRRDRGQVVVRGAGQRGGYGSGYVHNRPDAMLGEHVRGESHAWVDVWTGDWWGYDPTGDVAVGERHVVIATGRDYNDVTPLKGVYAGAALEALEVGVELIRRT